MSNPSFPYLEDDGWSWLLLQDPGGAEGLEVRVWVVEEVGVVVDQQRLDVVEDEAELVGVLHRVQARVVLRHQGGSEAAHARGVQHFTHLGRTNTGRGLKQNIFKKTVSGEKIPLLETLLGTRCTLRSCAAGAPPKNETSCVIQSSRINTDSSAQLSCLLFSFPCLRKNKNTARHQSFFPPL